ncbi:hypothetical protein D3C84_581230 [compost metagenome]
MFAQLGQGQAPGQGPVAGHERIGQEHPPGKSAGHLRQIARHLVRGGEQVRHLPRRLQALGQSAEAAACAQVKHRARAQGQVVPARVVGLQAHLLPGAPLQVPAEFLRRQPLAGFVRIGDQRRPLKHPQAGTGVIGQGDQLLAKPRQWFEYLRTGVGRALQGQRPDQRNAGPFQVHGEVHVQCRRQRGDQGEHLFFIDQLVQRLFGTGAIGTGVEYGQAQLPAVNAPRLVDTRHAALEHRRHRDALLAQWPGARQQRAQVQTVGGQARIAVFGQAFEVRREIALIVHRQHESWHRWIEPVIAGVAPLLHRLRQGAVAVGRVTAAVDVLLAMVAGQPRPIQVRWAHPAFRASEAVVAMTFGARQAGGRQQHVRCTDPDHDRLAAGRYTFAVQALAGTFAEVQRQRLDAEREAAEEQQAKDEGSIDGHG